MSNPLEDMQKPDVIFCIGTNMTECHPVAATGLKKAMANGATLRGVVIKLVDTEQHPLNVGSMDPWLIISLKENGFTKPAKTPEE